MQNAECGMGVQGMTPNSALRAPHPAFRRIRIGIDVGGTFTDLVALDNDSGEVLCQLKTLTTHTAAEGVAAGVRQVLHQAARVLEPHPGGVVFIAHATTQATNALLEGDVAPVGIVAMAERNRWLARRAARLKRIELAPGRALQPGFRFIRWNRAAGERFTGEARGAIAELVKEGAGVIVATEAFSVDHPGREQTVVELARAAGLPATAGHEVSRLYGLRTRTRTAAVNACILPRMIETAEMTARSVAAAGIAAPLMVMRSDGGVMSLQEMRRRPILTILSGPAAGVAGALLFEKVSTGIFLEFGGTSTDISVIRDGRAVMKPAWIGGHRTYLTTLDVRTVGIGGGSMAVVEGGRIVRVGPRSAHIAGLRYAAFERLSGRAACEPGRVAGDPGQYLLLREGEQRLAVTATCAANALGLVPVGNYAAAPGPSAGDAFRLVAAALRTTPQAAAQRILELASEKVIATCEELIWEYRLQRAHLELVGGGGAAGVLLPFVAQRLKLPFRIAACPEVISTIGVALAMVRETVERNVANPTPDDMLRIRREAEQAVLKQGAVAGTVEVEVQVDRQRHLVRAIAMGATEIRRKQAAVVGTGILARPLAPDGQECPSPPAPGLAGTGGAYLAQVAVRFLGGEGEVVGETARFVLFVRKGVLVAVDRDGVVRLQTRGCTVRPATAGTVRARLAEALDQFSTFGDAGRLLPEIHLVWGGRLLNLSSLADDAQVLALADVELRGLADSEPVYLLVKSR